MVSFICNSCRLTGARLCALLVASTIALTIVIQDRLSVSGNACPLLVLFMNGLITAYIIVISYIFFRITEGLAENVVMLPDEAIQGHAHNGIFFRITEGLAENVVMLPDEAIQGHAHNGIFFRITEGLAENVVMLPDEAIQGHAHNGVPLGDGAIYEVRCARCGRPMDRANILLDRGIEAKVDEESDGDNVN